MLWKIVLTDIYFFYMQSRSKPTLTFTFDMQVNYRKLKQWWSTIPQISWLRYSCICDILFFKLSLGRYEEIWSPNLTQNYFVKEHHLSIGTWRIGLVQSIYEETSDVHVASSSRYESVPAVQSISVTDVRRTCSFSVKIWISSSRTVNICNRIGLASIHFSRDAYA